jgi:hypothetical protein
VEHGLAAIAAGNPLAIAPDKNWLHQRLMLDGASDAAGNCGACLGVA